MIYLAEQFVSAALVSPWLRFSDSQRPNGPPQRPEKGWLPCTSRPSGNRPHILIHILLTCECFAPEQKDTRRARICATIPVEIRQQKMLLSMVSLSSTHTQLGSQADTTQTPPRPHPDAVKLKINFVTVAHRRIVSL